MNKIRVTVALLTKPKGSSLNLNSVWSLKSRHTNDKYFSNSNQCFFIIPLFCSREHLFAGVLYSQELEGSHFQSLLSSIVSSNSKQWADAWHLVVCFTRSLCFLQLLNSFNEVNVFVICWFVYYLTKPTILNIWHLIQRGTDVNSPGHCQGPHRLTLIIIQLLTARDVNRKIRRCFKKDFVKVMYRKFVCNWLILNIMKLENNFCLQNNIAWRIVTITD